MKYTSLFIWLRHVIQLCVFLMVTMALSSCQQQYSTFSQRSPLSQRSPFSQMEDDEFESTPLRINRELSTRVRIDPRYYDDGRPSSPPVRKRRSLFSQIEDDEEFESAPLRTSRELSARVTFDPRYYNDGQSSSSLAQTPRAQTEPPRPKSRLRWLPGWDRFSLRHDYEYKGTTGIDSFQFSTPPSSSGLTSGSVIIPRF